MMQRTEQTAITAVSRGNTAVKADQLVIEEPLEIVLAFYREGAAVRESIAITMRTPGDDFELVRGFLYAEGIIREQAEILALTYQGNQALREGTSNVVLVSLAPEVNVNIERLKRHFYTSSACGVCGKASLEALEFSGASPVLNDNFSIYESKMLLLPGDARKRQGLFIETGGAHAAAAFDGDGNIRCLREDIGRHNAVDKLIGTLTQDTALNIAEMGLFVSGRASFELLQKAAMAGFPLFAAVGAPSSLAVELAREFEITLAGFVQKNRFNIYNRPDRIQLLL